MSIKDKPKEEVPQNVKRRRKRKYYSLDYHGPYTDVRKVAKDFNKINMAQIDVLMAVEEQRNWNKPIAKLDKIYAEYSNFLKGWGIYVEDPDKKIVPKYLATFFGHIQKLIAKQAEEIRLLRKNEQDEIHKLENSIAALQKENAELRQQLGLNNT